MFSKICTSGNSISANVNGISNNELNHFQCSKYSKYFIRRIFQSNFTFGKGYGLTNTHTQSLIHAVLDWPILLSFLLCRWGHLLWSVSSVKKIIIGLYIWSYLQCTFVDILFHRCSSNSSNSTQIKLDTLWRLSASLHHRCRHRNYNLPRDDVSLEHPTMHRSSGPLQIDPPLSGRLSLDSRTTHEPLYTINVSCYRVC